MCFSFDPVHHVGDRPRGTVHQAVRTIHALVQNTVEALHFVVEHFLGQEGVLTSSELGAMVWRAQRLLGNQWITRPLGYSIGMVPCYLLTGHRPLSLLLHLVFRHVPRAPNSLSCSFGLTGAQERLGR